jgi:hypothetical protein
LVESQILPCNIAQLILRIIRHDSGVVGLRRGQHRSEVLGSQTCRRYSHLEDARRLEESVPT